MNNQFETQQDCLQGAAGPSGECLSDVTPGFHTAQAAQGLSKKDNMSAITFPDQKTQIDTTSRSTTGSARTKAQAAGALAGLAGGLTTALLGSLLTLAGWLVANEAVSNWLLTSGSVLLFLTIPLIVLGACCLDLVEKDKSQRWSKAFCDDDEER